LFSRRGQTGKRAADHRRETPPVFPDDNKKHMPRRYAAPGFERIRKVYDISPNHDRN
jgi:hypothetical protein